MVVADARYTLPDGSEGRTHASFAVGVAEGEGEALAPFPIDRSSGLSENVEARLHGEPERVWTPGVAAHPGRSFGAAPNSYRRPQKVYHDVNVPYRAFSLAIYRSLTIP